MAAECSQLSAPPRILPGRDHLAFDPTLSLEWPDHSVGINADILALPCLRATLKGYSCSRVSVLAEAAAVSASEFNISLPVSTVSPPSLSSVVPNSIHNKFPACRSPLQPVSREPDLRRGFFSGSAVTNPVTAMQELWVRSLGQEDTLEEGMATHSSILA